MNALKTLKLSLTINHFLPSKKYNKAQEGGRVPSVSASSGESPLNPDALLTCVGHEALSASDMRHNMGHAYNCHIGLVEFFWRHFDYHIYGLNATDVEAIYGDQCVG